MVRKMMTPAQLKAGVRRVERDQKLALDSLNREARKLNAAVKRAISSSYRELRTHNNKGGLTTGRS